MNKLFTKIAALSVGLAMAVGVGVAVGSRDSGAAREARAATYEIEFKTGTAKDGSPNNSSIGNSTTVSDVISSGASYVSSIGSGCSRAYKESTGGVKLGSGSYIGAVEINIASNYQSNITSIQIVSGRYGTDAGTLTLYVNGDSVKTGISTTDGGTHTFASATTVSTIKVATSEKRAYVSKIILTAGSSAKVDNVTLSATTAGGPNYNAGGASSFQVAFTTAVTYDGTAGNHKVNITSSPNTGVSGLGNNLSDGAFTLTFTQSGTYTITSTSAENSQKSANVQIRIDNIVVPSFNLVTNINSLGDGSKIIIHSSYTKDKVDYQKVLSTSQNSNNVPGVDLAITGTSIAKATVESSDADIITLEREDTYWLLKSSVDGKYFYSTTNNTSSNKLLRGTLPSPVTNQYKFSISVDSETGFASILSGHAADKKIQVNHNSGNALICFYPGSQYDVSIYALPNTNPYFSISSSDLYVGVRGETQLSISAFNGATATATWSIDSNTYADISSTSGTSITVTGKAVGDAKVTVSFSPNTFKSLACNIHVIAIDEYVSIGVTKFTKVEAAPSSWEGSYLIVYEGDENNDPVAFDGSASPLIADSKVGVTISGTEIDATTAMLNSSFNVKATSTANEYTLRSSSGFYVGGGDKVTNISATEQYHISFTNAFKIATVVNTTTYVMRLNSGVFRFYSTNTGSVLFLYKADGERRAITSTLTTFHDTIKTNGYLNCNSSGTGSSINFNGISGLYTSLSDDDKDTLKRMSAKASENGGNYLEDLMSDYDYLIRYKGYSGNDILGRFSEGGVNYEERAFLNPSPLSSIGNNSEIIVVITLVSVASAAAIGGYFFIRRRKEQ